MPTVITNTRLWTTTLAPQEGPDGAVLARERLRTVFLTFRERVSALVGEIHKELPEYTVHDISHLDALWEMADIIVGNDFNLTPTEAFVLGGAILLHDAGMALAAYPQGLDALRGEETWSDLVTKEYQTQYQRLPSSDEITSPSEEIRRRVVPVILRKFHAQQAEKLASISWQADVNEAAQYLIDDHEIRQVFGRIIGLIAHSHWWSLDRVEKEFSQILGAPVWCPHTWTIDPRNIACLLRVADASHIDARRAPSFLRALRKPSSHADEHWKFQEKLQKPRLSEDALVFTSGYAFPLQDASAWWLCLDALRLIDQELRQVDALLADHKLQRFAARRVADVDSPERLASKVPTDGWTPVDARVQVSDVLRLVQNLGGTELYGDDLTVPLRELIQNAADAVRARRVVEDRHNQWGNIHVRLGTDAQGDWLEVEDTGIGMSSQVLTRYLLDFGTSYWGSNLMLDEFPGLMTSGIKPTGRYGIGFFSVFMLGTAVQVRTRRADAAVHDTIVLEFNTGLSTKPILRRASKEERIRDGGTIIRVWLHQSPQASGGLLMQHRNQAPYTLHRLCLRLCPSLDVNVTAHHNNTTTLVVSSSDWISISSMELLRRIYYAENDELVDVQQDDQEYLACVGQNLRLLKDENEEVVGRACVALDTLDIIRSSAQVPALRGVVTIGGLQSAWVSGIAGILTGTSERAARDAAQPIVSQQALAAWASEQALLVPNLYHDPEEQVCCAEAIYRCGGNTNNLPIAWYKDGWVGYQDLVQETNIPDKLLFVQPYYVDSFEQLPGFELSPDVVVVEHQGASSMIQGGGIVFWPNYPEEPQEHHMGWFEETLAGLVVEALAKVWKVSTNSIYEYSYTRDPKDQQVIGHVNGAPVEASATIIRRPR